MKKLSVFADPNLDRQIEEIVREWNKPIPIFADNAAALAGGLKIGNFYRTGADPDPVCVVH